MSPVSPVTPVEMVDTDVLIEVQRGNPVAVNWLASLPTLPLLPGLVQMEMLAGAMNTAELRQIQTLLAPFTVVWPDAADCAQAVQWLTAYHLRNQIGVIDTLIAACAVGRGATLYTFNVRHYKVIPGLLYAKPFTR